MARTWNPRRLRMNHRGQLLDPYGREFVMDEKQFQKRRKDRKFPLNASLEVKRT